MAQLNDTMVHGDLNVTGHIYGDALNVRTNTTLNGNLLIQPGNGTGSTNPYLKISNAADTYRITESIDPSNGPVIRVDNTTANTYSKIDYGSILVADSSSSTSVGITANRLILSAPSNQETDLCIQLGSGRFIRPNNFSAYGPGLEFIDSMGSGFQHIAIRASAFIGQLVGEADHAIKATRDGSGRNIVDTYATKANTLQVKIRNYNSVHYDFDGTDTTGLTKIIDTGIYYINTTTDYGGPMSGKQVIIVLNYSASSSVIYQIALGWKIMARRKYNNDAWRNWVDIISV